MEKLIPWSGSEAVCPKCGTGVLGAMYCRGDYSRPFSCRIRDQEHMHRTCPLCQYERCEHPADVPRAGEGNQRSTVAEVAARMKPGESPTVLGALRAAADAFGEDTPAPRTGEGK